MEEAAVLSERRAGYRVVTLNRPQRLNAFTEAMHQDHALRARSYARHLGIAAKSGNVVDDPRSGVESFRGDPRLIGVDRDRNLDAAGQSRDEFVKQFKKLGVLLSMN